MNLKIVYLILLVGVMLFISACTKEKNHVVQNVTGYDTIFPLDYFPVFPGSYWEYIDSSNYKTVIRTDSSFKKDYYFHLYGGVPTSFSDTFFVPIYDGVPIWGYEEHTGPTTNYRSSPLIRILSDSLPVGSNWPIFYFQGREISRKIIAKDTSINISSKVYYPTIVVDEYYSQGPSEYVWINRRYYTKNIGLIREDRNFIPDSMYSRFIVKHFINN